jgi:hypothetical protein
VRCFDGTKVVAQIFPFITPAKFRGGHAQPPNKYVNRTLRLHGFGGHLSFSCVGARPVTSALGVTSVAFIVVVPLMTQALAWLAVVVHAVADRGAPHSVTV